MARAGRAGARRRGARRRSRVCHQCRAREAPRRHRRAGADGVRRHRRDALTQKLAACRHRLCPRQRHRRACRASAAAPHRGRDAVGRGVLSGAGRAPRRRAPPLRRGAGARRAQRMRLGPSSWRARSPASERVSDGATTLVSRTSAASVLARAERDPGPSARRAKRNIECTARRAAPGPRLFALARSAGAREGILPCHGHLSHLTSALRCLVER